MVTGGSGFVGSYVTSLLVEKGVEAVVVFDRYPSYERIADVVDRVTVVEGDVLEPQELLAAMVEHRIDRVAHLAALPGIEAPGKIVPYLRLATMGSANVFETARLHGIKRVVIASSCAAIGPHPEVQRSTPEDDLEPPDNLYGICKLWSEHVAQYYNAAHGMEIVSLRICSVIGHGRTGRTSLRTGLMSETPNVMALPELAALGQPVTMPPDDELLDFLHAADAAQAWWLALSADKLEHWVFNVRSDQRPAGDLTKHLRQLLPDAQIVVGDKRTPLPPVMDNTRLIEELGFEPRYPLEAAVDDYVERVLAGAG
jgi:nucleoside-diphosphate-sugar epimerase